VKWKRNAHAN